MSWLIAHHLPDKIWKNLWVSRLASWMKSNQGTLHGAGIPHSFEVILHRRHSVRCPHEHLKSLLLSIYLEDSSCVILAHKSVELFSPFLQLGKHFTHSETPELLCEFWWVFFCLFFWPCRVELFSEMAGDKKICSVRRQKIKFHFAQCLYYFYDLGAGWPFLSSFLCLHCFRHCPTAPPDNTGFFLCVRTPCRVWAAFVFQKQRFYSGGQHSHADHCNQSQFVANTENWDQCGEVQVSDLKPVIH